jgi:hypothetical protein
MYRITRKKTKKEAEEKKNVRIIHCFRTDLIGTTQRGKVVPVLNYGGVDV